PAARGAGSGQGHRRRPRMTMCDRHLSGDLDLYFYDELPSSSRENFEQHLSTCAECQAALEELQAIRAALASRPVVSAPTSGDWSSFMSRLDAALVHERAQRSLVSFVPRSGRPYVGYLAVAALLTLVTLSVAVTLR